MSIFKNTRSAGCSAVSEKPRRSVERRNEPWNIEGLCLLILCMRVPMVRISNFQYSNFLDDTELCAARTGILSPFFLARTERFFRHAKSDAVLLPRGKCLFDDTVFDAVERNDRELPARRKLPPRTSQTFRECAQFVIDRYPKCLERARRRMYPAAAVGRRHGAFDDFRKLPRSLDRLSRPCFDYRPRNPSRVALLSPTPYDIRDVLFFPLVHDLLRRELLRSYLRRIRHEKRLIL